MKPVPQMVVLVCIAVFTLLGYFAGANHAERYDEKDLNKDGEVNFTDFSISLYLVGEIAEALGGEAQHTQNY